MRGKTAAANPPLGELQRKENGGHPWRRMLLMVCALAAVLAGILYVNWPDPPADLDALLEGYGFVRNPGFAPTFRPGDVIQITETDGKGGGRRLARPVLFLRREECFPMLVPTTAAFALASRSGQRSGSLQVQGERAGRLLSGLRLGGQEVRSYALTIERPQIATFARAELSGQFAGTCVKRFQEALESGDRPAWFGTVIEIVFADALILTVEWRAKTTEEVRARRVSNLRRELPGVAGPVATTLDSSEKTVLRATGPVLLGYRYRPMEPVK
jgi:hypothetical protein